MGSGDITQLPSVSEPSPFNPFLSKMTKTIHLFPKFPIEVRIEIWHYAIDAPHVVHANWPYKTKRCGLKNNPVLLFVNQESQQEASKRYKKVSDDDDIYADFSQDTIFVDSGYLSFRLDRTNYESRIQILAIDHSYFLYKTKLLFWKIRQYSKLRKLILVIPAQIDLDLSNAKLDNPTLSIKFKELNTENYCFYKQVRRDVSVYFERIWGLLNTDLHYLEVYLVKCYTKIKQAVLD